MLIDVVACKKAWALLNKRERKSAWIVLSIMMVAALSSAVMVGSILPFLSVLSDPDLITTDPTLSWVYDTFNFESDYSFLIGLGVASLIVIVLTTAIQIMKTWTVARFSAMRVHSISHRLLGVYLRQPYEFFLLRHSGDMGTRILSEAGQAVTKFFSPFAEFTASLLTVLAILAMLIAVEPVVTFIAFGSLGGIYAAIFFTSRRMLARLGRVRVEANRGRFRISNEALGGVKHIKLLGRENEYLARYKAPSHKMARAGTMVQVLTSTPQLALQAVAFGGMIVLCVFLIEEDGLASGDALGGILPVIGFFAFAGQRLMPELSKLYKSVAQLQAGAAAVDVMYEDLIDRAPGTALPKAIPGGLGLKEGLSFEGVSYTYPSSDRAGIHKITLDIRAGERVGIVGGTGAGKTTFADLVLGLLSPSDGGILADGLLLNEENIRSWQQSVGYVPQDIFLIDASISENIALGLPPEKIDQARVKSAALIAQLDEFILNELPEGYATAVGERGVRLSGGQRQRIGIARALYHQADLIVFDEATSALDNRTEGDVLAAIEELPNSKTILMIAHRLSTVRNCDRIVVMDKGEIVGFDTWDHLIKHNEIFRALAQSFEEREHSA